MNNMQRLLLTFALVLLPAASTFAGDTEFARVAEDEQQRPLALQLAIASYVSRIGDSSVQVDLISAVHIGDAEYYDDLNQRFRSYDAMLYELIAPKDAVISDRDSESKGIISSTQIAMKNMLDRVTI